MSTILLEGFDQYGVGPGPATTLAQGGWVVAGGGDLATEVTIVPPLGFAGSALQIAPAIVSGDCAVTVTKPLIGNYNRIMGGVRVSVDYPDADGLFGFMFMDGTTAQCSIWIQAVTGFVYITEGSDGTLLQQSVALIQDTAQHYIEYDITFDTGMDGAWTVWVDGVMQLSGNGATQQSANSYCNAFEYVGYIPNENVAAYSIFDDQYVFDDQTSIDNEVLLTNPFVYTQWPAGELTAEFTNEGTFATNWQTEGLNPPVGDTQRVTGAVPNKDLYSFDPLPTEILTVHSVGISGNCRLLAPTHTVDLLVSSNSVESAGLLPGQTPDVTYLWLDTYVDADPNTTDNWTVSGVNLSYGGMKVVT